MRKRALFRFTPFAELPRRQRRDRYVSLRWKIMRDTSTYGGKFTSRLVLNEPGRPKLYNQWFDFYFLGSDGITIWNATLSTATAEFWNETRSLAFERAISLLTEDEREQECELKFEPCISNGQRCYRMVEREPHVYDCFGGLTLPEYKKKSEQEIIANEPPSIYESFEVDSGYQYGTGLIGIVNAEEINRDVIETTIDRFRQIGETNWQSPAPVPREALPFETEESALSKVAYPSVLLGIAQRA